MKTTSGAEAIKAAAVDVLGTVDMFNDKAFLADVYNKIAGHNPGLTLAGFKAMCVELHFAGQLNLSRCDLVEDFAADVVDASQVHYDGCTFHYVRLG